MDWSVPESGFADVDSLAVTPTSSQSKSPVEGSASTSCMGYK